VIDTSVLIAAMLGDGSACEIFRRIESGELIWYIGKDILHEYRVIMSRKKFNISDDDRKYWNQVIEKYARYVIDVEAVKFSRDPSDSRFISLAVSVDADCLISSDKAILAWGHMLRARICTPDDFLRLIQTVK
jgi:putative PIN family toxin of toxin-antitoxin system